MSLRSVHPVVLCCMPKLRRRQRGLVMMVDQYSYAASNALRTPVYDDLLLGLTAENAPTEVTDESPFGWHFNSSSVFSNNSVTKFGTYSYDTSVGGTICRPYTQSPAPWFSLQRSTATVGFWMRLKTLSGNMGIIGQRDSTGSNNGWALFVLASGEIELIYDSSTLDTSGAGISTGIWYHVLLSISGGIAYLFVDGVLLATGAVSFGVSNVFNESLRIAGHVSNVTFDGYLDDVFITDELLTTTAFSPPTSPLVGTHPGGYSTWNASDKAALIFLSANARSANLNGQAFGLGAVRGTQGRAVGTDYYFEVSHMGGLVTTPSADVNSLSGVGKSSATLSFYPGFDADAWSYFNVSGRGVNNNTSTAVYGATGISTVGVWLTASGGLRFKTSPSDPVTDCFSGLTGTLYPIWGPGTAAGIHAGSLNTGATTFRLGLPAGASAWG